jgi:hypothetical protein
MRSQTKTISSTEGWLRAWLEEGFQLLLRLPKAEPIGQSSGGKVRGRRLIFSGKVIQFPNR